MSNTKTTASPSVVSKKPDRRILRTRRMLRDALISLMDEKEFSQITARDVTERADLNRGTFYLHYNSTNELLESICRDLLKEMEEAIDVFQPKQRHESLKSIVNHIVTFIEQDRTLYRILLINMHSEAMVQGIAHILLEKGLQLRSQAPADDGSIHATDQQLIYSCYFITYGIVAVIRQWFRRGCDLSADELKDYIYQFVSPVITMATDIRS